MKAHLQIDDKQVANMDLEIAITLKVSEWRDIMKQLPHSWPSWVVSNMIGEALGHVSRATDAKLEIKK